MQEYIPSDVPAEPLKAHLDEAGTTLALDKLVDEALGEGATLHLDSSSLDPIQLAAPQEQKQIKLTRAKFLQILSQMLATEQITRKQMLEMRRRFGISNASFHAKKRNKTKIKKAKALAYSNKRTNRLNKSTKGENKRSGEHR